MKKFLYGGMIFTLILRCLTGCMSNEIRYSGNPILPGVYADPCILVHLDTFYIYGTTGGYASAWYSADFQNWKMRKLNWPTSMNKPNIWAPAITQGMDGRFYFYASTDHNIYAAVADHPLGPYENILGGDSIFIKNRQWWEKMHSIDADCFIDDDRQAYLYWGSGFDFVDGICAVGMLGTDMASFRDDPILVTPEGYFEGPHMIKRDGLYYLMYSDGHYYDSTYKVRYAISDSPLGPFSQGRNSPILKSESGVSGPGHHYTFRSGDDYYIIYHAHAQPIYKPRGGPMRQVFIDKLEFESDGSMKKVIPTDHGVKLDFIKTPVAKLPVRPESVQVSSQTGPEYDGMKAFDSDYGTLWAADKNNLPVLLTADFGKRRRFYSCELIFDVIDGDYDYEIEYSLNGSDWELYASGNNSQYEEWPFEHQMEVEARHFRIHIDQQTGRPGRVGLWEARFF